MNTKDSKNMTPEFVRLLTSSQTHIYAYIMSLAGNCNDADDIMQETTTTMWRKFSEFKSGTDFLAWGLRIAYFKVCEFRVKNRRKYNFDDKIIEMIQSKASRELSDTNVYLEKLQECVKGLKKEDHQIVKLHYTSGVSIKLLSARLNLQVRTLYYRLSRIHGQLMRCIERSILRDSKS